MKPEAELIRKRYLYRRLVIRGDARVSRETAKRLVGPDCAYHLYGPVQNSKPKARRKTR